MTFGKAEAIAHGAATIINAIATGKGAAFGVDLWTKAQIEITDDPKVIKAEIMSDSTESTVLIERTVLRVLEHFKVENQFGGKVKTSSNIPIARGLKSSSVAANAVALATVAALGKTASDIDIVNLGVKAAFDAKVTVTGAFDDACASFFGGVVITDNLKRRIVKCSTFLEDLVVLFYVPSQKSYTANSDVAKMMAVKPFVEVAYKEALRGNFWIALSLNGLIYSSVLGYTASVALDAINAGAMASGLCGKGPAITAVVQEDKVDQVEAALKKHKGEVIKTKPNQEKAKVVS